MGVLYILDEPSHRPAPARQPQAHRDPRAAARPGQHAPGGRARRGDDRGGRPRHRHRARRRASTAGEVVAAGDAGRHRGATRRRHRRSSCRACGDRRSRSGGAGQRQGWITISGAREHNLKDIDVGVPAGALVVRHRRVRARASSTLINEMLLQGAGQPSTGASRAARRARPHRRAGAHRQGDRHRPVADRAHAALQPGHLHRAVRP